MTEYQSLSREVLLNLSYLFTDAKADLQYTIHILRCNDQKLKKDEVFKYLGSVFQTTEFRWSGQNGGRKWDLVTNGRP